MPCHCVSQLQTSDTQAAGFHSSKNEEGGAEGELCPSAEHGGFLCLISFVVIVTRRKSRYFDFLEVGSVNVKAISLLKFTQQAVKCSRGFH